MRNVDIGYGALALARPWGPERDSIVPTDQQAFSFLRGAYRNEIRFFDTAPSYASRDADSEERLGRLIRVVGRTPNASDALAELTIATKFGEHWNPLYYKRDDPDSGYYADHSAKELIRSIDASIAKLGEGRIDILQLHKPSRAVLSSPDLEQAIAYAEEQGITNFGVSVKDHDTAQAAIETGLFNSLQVPAREMAIIQMAADIGLRVIVNRPLDSGESVKKADNKHAAMVRAYKRILEINFDGVILTGTTNGDHLLANIRAFNVAKSMVKAERSMSE